MHDDWLRGTTRIMPCIAAVAWGFTESTTACSPPDRRSLASSFASLTPCGAVAPRRTPVLLCSPEPPVSLDTRLSVLLRSLVFPTCALPLSWERHRFLSRSPRLLPHLFHRKRVGAAGGCPLQPTIGASISSPPSASRVGTRRLP